MKTILKWIVSFLLVGILLGCEKDSPIVNPTINPVVVQFDQDIIIAENSGSTEIKLKLNKAAFQEGELRIQVSTDFSDAFETSPTMEDDIIEIPIAKGERFPAFSILPLQNNVFEENKIIHFDLFSVSEGFELGSKREMTVTITDEEIPAQVFANFPDSIGVLHENDTEGIQISFTLSGLSPADGKLIIQLTQDIERFTTEPALNASDQILIPVLANTQSASFKIVPINNELVDGHASAEFTLVATEGPIQKGTQLSYKLTFMDDESIAKAKSYETTGGGWRAKKTYEYDLFGKIKAIKWETETPGLRTGTDSYFFGDNDLISRVNYYPNHDEYFYQENGRIARSEIIENGVKKSYSLYGYDTEGNVGEKAIFNLQSSGEYTLSLLFVYLYFTDGNLYKQLTYIPIEDTTEYQLISTRTYANYLDKPNLFHTADIIPNIPAQTHLPGSYRLEESGSNLFYTFAYEFREDGLAIKRTTHGSSSPEVTVYQYY